MNITPQVDFLHSSGFLFKNRVVYPVLEKTATEYVVKLDDVMYLLAISEDWVELPDNIVLDSRTMLEKVYDRLKQRDVDYIKVYKERMGIHTFNSYAEEDYFRHRGQGPTPDVGLPEGHTASEG